MMSETGSIANSIVSTSSRSVIRRSFVSFLIYENSKHYRLFNYLICVHLATWTALWYSLVVAVLPLQHPNSKLATIITACIVDLIFIVKMIIDSRLSYVDAESGILVTDLPVIRRRYFLSLSRFWLNLCTTLPVNLFILCATSKQLYIRFGYINRIFRWYYVVLYYRNEQRDLNVKPHLRWTYLIYNLLLSVQIATCVW